VEDTNIIISGRKFESNAKQKRHYFDNGPASSKETSPLLKAFQKEIQYISQVDTEKCQVLKPCLSQSVHVH
jgi:hypothetical protein